MESYSLADVAAATRGNSATGAFGGGGEGLWLFAILALMSGGFGGLGGFGAKGAIGNCASTEDVANGFSFSALQNKTNEILMSNHNINQNLSNAICNLGYQNSRDFASISQQLSDCCCTTQRSIDAVKFDMANYAAMTNANTTAGIQKVLDRLSEDKIQSQAQKIAQLELSQALCGVVRYPTTTTFNAPFNPFFNNMNNCCAN